jgi:osmoprotectant transport system substrate-binding protein
MTQVKRTVRIAALSLAVGLTLAACGADDGGTADPGGGTTPAPAPAPADAPTVVVGSKDFTENILLGQMLVIALEEAGFDVEDRTNLGGTVVNRDALLAGQIGVYPEYNGTGWTVHLGEQDPSFDRQELYELVADADLDRNGIRWVGLSPFNNTYGFASSPAATAANGGQPFTFQSMADYLSANPDAVACMESEFPDRPDGLILWEDHTGYTMPQSQQVILETGVIYTETGNDNCDFGEVFTTDGRIDGLGLTLVDDPGVMILYNMSFTFRDDVLADLPAEVVTIAEQILAALDNEAMVALNFEVDINGREYDDVAREHLESIGLA